MPLTNEETVNTILGKTHLWEGKTYLANDLPQPIPKSLYIAINGSAPSIDLDQQSVVASVKDSQDDTVVQAFLSVGTNGLTDMVLANGKVLINHSDLTSEQLSAIPGLGETTATRLLQDRSVEGYTSESLYGKLVELQRINKIDWDLVNSLIDYAAV